MNRRRTVITGMGPVSAAGMGREAFSAAVMAGTSGIRPVTAFETSNCNSKIAAVIDSFDMGQYLLSQKNYLDRTSELAFAALSLALTDAGIEPADLDRNAALLLGTAYGNMETARIFFADLLEKGPRFTKPVLFPHSYSNTSISLLAMEYGITGYHVNFSSGNISSALSVIEAFDIIRSGRVSMALAGGCDSLNHSLFLGLDRQGVLARAATPADFSGPYRKERSGFAAGEGAGFLVLETLESAKARGAVISGELAGCALVNSPALSADQITRAMKSAIAQAGLAPADIDLIIGNGDGSIETDDRELKAISALAAEAGRQFAVTSTGAITGNAFGASCLLQIASALAVIETGTVPSTGGTGTLESIPGVTLQAAPVKRETARILINNIDPGGSMASMVVTRCPN